MMIQNFQLLGSVHRVIKSQTKGTPEDIAQLLNISRSCLYKYIDELAVLGANIKYCRTCRCFKYTSNFTLKITLEINEMNKVIGGKGEDYNFFPSVHEKWTEDFYLHIVKDEI